MSGPHERPVFFIISATVHQHLHIALPSFGVCISWSHERVHAIFTGVVETDPTDVLNKKKCLEYLAALRHAKWFQVNVSQICQIPSFFKGNLWWYIHGIQCVILQKLMSAGNRCYFLLRLKTDNGILSESDTNTHATCKQTLLIIISLKRNHAVLPTWHLRLFIFHYLNSPKIMTTNS